ncbi:hypothetical protein OAU29_01885 [Porticoccaceae bacterium]|nr:hypothetical protein [Porticoccaceae bacterium]|tara:strand:- start:111 stop:380 length:270 start_codon:yes stop_codon:yes gene_type:complete
MRTNIADNTLFLEMLGKGNGTEVFTTAAQTSKDWYCVFFPIDSVITTIAGNATNITALNGQSISAGSTLFLNITAITLASGIGIGYPNH